jgi:pimeloyl-ACP methyl ester carboxylesterase
LEHTPFLAIDWFGMGMSDDYKGADASDTFCTFEEMAQYLRKIADVEHVKKFVPVGNLKGANPAIELAYQAGSSRVQHLVLMNPLILSAKAKAFMNDVYEPMLRNQALSVNGSHLIAAWMDPSAAAMGPDGAPWSNSRDLLSNQEKTNDELRCLSTGWQYGAAWVAYNEQNEPRMATVDSYAKSLFLYGTRSLADLEKYGLNPQFSDESFAKALSHGRNSTIYVHGGSQGMVIQNSSMIASKVAEFIKSTAARVVV